MKAFVNTTKMVLQVKSSSECTKDDEKLTQVELYQKAKFTGTEDEKTELKIDIFEECRDMDSKINKMTPE